MKIERAGKATEGAGLNHPFTVVVTDHAAALALYNALGQDGEPIRSGDSWALVVRATGIEDARANVHAWYRGPATVHALTKDNCDCGELIIPDPEFVDGTWYICDLPSAHAHRYPEKGA